jgi:hypothetical protein
LDNAQFMQERLRELAEENQRLKAGGAQGEPQSKAAAVEGELKLDLAAEDFTEEEQRLFGEKTQRYVTKVIRAEVAKILAPVLGRINALSTSSGTLQKQLEDVTTATTAIAPIAIRSAEKEFYEKEIGAHYPDFAARRTSSEWKAFVMSVDPVYRRPYLDLLREASLRFDGPNARRVLAAFYDKHPSQPAAQQSGIAVEAPSSAGAASAVGAPGPTQVPKFKYSVYTAAFKNWQRAPKNPAARQEYDKVKAQYDAAIAVGAVDFNS